MDINNYSAEERLAHEKQILQYQYKIWQLEDERSDLVSYKKKKQFYLNETK